MDALHRPGLVGCSDAELIAASRDRSEPFGMVFDRHEAALRRWVFGVVGDRDVAADLVAEAFARAWTKRRRYRDPGDGSAWPWLCAIALNLTRDYWRSERIDRRARDRLRIDSEIVDPTDAADERLDAAARAARLQPLLDALSPALRAALLGRCVQNLSYPQLAEQLGTSQLATRARVSRALRALRDLPDQPSALHAPDLTLT